MASGRCSRPPGGAFLEACGPHTWFCACQSSSLRLATLASPSCCSTPCSMPSGFAQGCRSSTPTMSSAEAEGVRLPTPLTPGSPGVAAEGPRLIREGVPTPGVLGLL